MTSGAAALWLAAHDSSIQQRYPFPWQRVEAFRRMARQTAWVPAGWLADQGFGAGILKVDLLMDAARLPEATELSRR
jgi:hypothetical protein